jgi:hypothetical protein
MNIQGGGMMVRSILRKILPRRKKQFIDLSNIYLFYSQKYMYYKCRISAKIDSPMKATSVTQHWAD